MGAIGLGTFLVVAAAVVVAAVIRGERGRFCENTEVGASGGYHVTMVVEETRAT